MRLFNGRAYMYAKKENTKAKGLANEEREERKINIDRSSQKSPGDSGTSRTFLYHIINKC